MLFFLVLLAYGGQESQAQYAAGTCPEPYGVQTYPDEKYCDKFYEQIDKVYFHNFFAWFKALFVSR